MPSPVARMLPRDAAAMRWLLWRELAVITRTPAFWIAAAAHLLVLAAFLVVWGDGVPVLRGTVFEQFTGVQAVVLSLVLPWAAFRAGTGSPSHDATLRVVASCTGPQLFVTRYLGITMALLVLVVSALPMKVVALRISSLDSARLVADMAPAVAGCAYVGALVALFTASSDRRLASWFAVTVATLAGTLLLRSDAALPGVTIVSALAVATAAALRVKPPQEQR